MAKFNFSSNSFGVNFTNAAYDFDHGYVINQINNIYSIAYTENSNSAIRAWGYLRSYGYSFDYLAKLSSRSEYSGTLSDLELTIYRNNIEYFKANIEGSVSFNATAITGGNITKESYRFINGDSVVYEGNYKVNKVGTYFNLGQYSKIYEYLVNGNDNFIGTSKSDIIDSGPGNDLVNGKQGDDTLIGSSGKDQLNGGSGNDTLNGGSGKDILYGGENNDNLIAGPDNDKLYGGGGSDNLKGALGDDLINGGSGIDVAVFSARSNIVNLGITARQNTKDGRDKLVGIENVNGGAGNDSITGNNGNNILNGQDGNDILIGGKGNDTLIGEVGNDILNGGKGNDILNGSTGTDTAVFSSRSNIVNLGTTARQNTKDGRDKLVGIENVNGGAGNDSITGNNSNNTLNGQDGNDTLIGKKGVDILIGGKGNDIISGGGGNDILTGSKGDDQLTGGGGDDIFKIKTGLGRDVITDYTYGEDRIKLLSGLETTDLTLSNVGGNAKIKYNDDLLAIVQNTVAADIDFI